MSRPRKAYISKYLLHGAENALSASQLCEMTGYNTDVDIRRGVAHERNRGIVILSNQDGYFLPDRGQKGKAELSEYIEMMESRIRKIEAAVIPARMAWAAYESALPKEG